MKPTLDPRLESVIAEVDGPDRAVIVTDGGGVILWWSTGAEVLYGWRRAEVLGRHILGVTPATLSMGEGARILSQLQAGIEWEGEYEVRTRSGEQMPVRVRDLPVRNEAGELVGIVGISWRVPARESGGVT